MAAKNSSSQSQNHTKSAVGSIFSTGFLSTRSLSHTETTLMGSPVSILDTASSLTNPSNSIANSVQSFDKLSSSSPGIKLCCEEIGCNISSRGIGLILDEKLTENYNLGEFNSTRILFGIGSNLKIQIPHLPSPPAADFGIKSTRDSSSSSQMVMSPLWMINTPKSTTTTVVSSLSEMELSEDYTCVINHGPNPRTTHIFDNCIVHDNLLVSLSHSNTTTSTHQ